MPQRWLRVLVILAIALGVLFGGRAIGLSEPVLVAVIVVFALLTRTFVRRR